MKAQIKINTTAQDFIITLVKIEITGCMHAQLGGGGSTPDFKWQEWSNGRKNHNTKKSLGLQTKLPKNTWTKIQPPKPFYLSHIDTATQKKYLPKFSYPKKSWNQKFQTSPPPPPPIHGNNSSHAQGPTTSRTWQVRGPFCKL